MQAITHDLVKVELTIPPHTLPELKSAVDVLGCAGLTVLEVLTDTVTEGAGALRHWRRGGIYRRHRSALRIEIVAPQRRLEEMLEVLGDLARETGGYGNPVVLPVSGAIRIRTREVAESAVGG